MKDGTAQRKLMLWLVVVLILSILLRIMLITTYPPYIFNDTSGYFRAAQAIENGFQNYDGTRTPIYPAFIALLGSESAVYTGQLILGICITMAWFIIGYKTSGQPLFGAVIAIAHSLNPGQFFFEASLLTETLATFWLMLSFVGAYFWLSNENSRSVWLGLGIGVGAALSALTRPQFIFFPFLVALFLAFSYQDKHINLNWKPLLWVLLPAIVIIGGWMGWIYSRYHILSVTAMSGFHTVQHTGYYFEDVPDEDAALRDVYIEFREERIETYGTQGNTIWDAIPAMQEASGLNFYELSARLQEISIQLIISHPWEYLQRVIKGWLLFWRAPVSWDMTAVKIPLMSTLMQVFVFGARGLMLIMNFVFIISSLSALVFKRLRYLWQLTPFHWLFACSIWGTSILTSLVEHGENQRFLIPLQSAVIFWVLWMGFAQFVNRSENQKDPAKINI